MTIVSIEEAETQLASLVDRAVKGEEIVVARAETPLVRLVAVVPNESPRQGGQWRVRVRITDDLDALPPDIGAAFGMEAPRGATAPRVPSGDRAP